MSNYTINIDWDGKDALADGSAAKVISGDDFQTEFETVQTAVNSKADLNGSSSEDFAMDNGTVAGTLAVTGATTLTGTTTLGGNPTTTTQSAGNNTTRIATTEFVTTAANALNAAAYPVGSIFTTTVAYADSDAVVTAIGGTTWAAFGAGKVLVGLDAGDTDFDTSEETGGAKTDSHTLSTDEIPAHTHTIASHVTDGASNQGVMNSSTAEGTKTTNANTTTGSAHEHDIVQPYIVVYFWKRTA